MEEEASKTDWGGACDRLGKKQEREDPLWKTLKDNIP